MEQRPVDDVERVDQRFRGAVWKPDQLRRLGDEGSHCGDVLADGGEIVIDDVQGLADRRVVLDRGDEGVGHVLDPCHRQHAPRARTQPPRSGELDAEQRVPELAAAVDEPRTDDGRAATPRGDELLLGQLHLCVFVARARLVFDRGVLGEEGAARQREVVVDGEGAAQHEPVHIDGGHGVEQVLGGDDGSREASRKVARLHCCQVHDRRAAGHRVVETATLTQVDARDFEP